MTGKRVRKVRRGFNSQKEAYEAKTAKLKEAHDIGQISNSGMDFNTFMEQLFIPEYKAKVQIIYSTFNLDDYYEHYSFVIVLLYFMTGLQVNEATALRWNEEIDLDKGTITVNHSLRLKNKNVGSLGPTKTKAALRTIAIDSDTNSILQAWKARQSQLTDSKYVIFI